MFSGKTSELIRRLRRAKCAGQTTRLFKYSNDTRYTRESLASSHDGITEQATPIADAKSMGDLSNIQVVGIDEGQFIDNLVVVAQLLADQGKHVIITALNSDFRRQLWPRITELLPLCDEVVTLYAVCHSCKKDAAFTKRIGSSEQLEVIGGAELYEASCRGCFLK